MLTATQNDVVELARRHGRVYRDGATVHATTHSGAMIRKKITDPLFLDLVRRGLLKFVQDDDGRDPHYEPTRPINDDQKIAFHFRDVERLEQAVQVYRAALEEASLLERWGDKIPAEILKITLDRLNEVARETQAKLREEWI